MATKPQRKSRHLERALLQITIIIVSLHYECLQKLPIFSLMLDY